MTKQELNAMKLRMAELFKSFTALRATKLVKSAMQKAPQTADNLIKAIQAYNQQAIIFWNLHDSYNWSEADKLFPKEKKAAPVRQKDVDKYINELTTYKQCVANVEKFEVFLENIKDDTTKKVVVEQIENKNNEKAEIQKIDTVYLLVLTMAANSAEVGLAFPDIWNNRIALNTASLDVSQKDVADMQTVEKYVTDWLSLYNTIIANSPNDASFFSLKRARVSNSSSSRYTSQTKRNPRCFYTFGRKACRFKKSASDARTRQYIS